MRAPMRFKDNAGLTLIETVIVLGVFSVIIAAVWLVVSVVYENVKQTAATRNLQTIVQNVRGLLVRVPSITSGGPATNTNALDAQGAFPLEMRVNQTACPVTLASCGQLNHPWGSNTSGTVTVGYVNGSTFSITFRELSKKACIGLATRLSGGEISNLTGMTINGTVPSGGLPLTSVSADLACTAAGNTNIIVWQFNIRA